MSVNFTRIEFDVIDPLLLTTSRVSAYVTNVVADSEWHYMCVDLYQAYLDTNPEVSYPQGSLKVAMVCTP